MEIFYHGTSVLFDNFDLAHALEGDGKVKFGYGVYVTQMYKTAAHYSGSGRGKSAADHYVYTIEVPNITEDNHIWSNKPVHPEIVKRAEAKLGETVPAELVSVGKMLRKYIGNKVLGRTGTIKQLSGKADLEAEKAASQFLLSIGVEMLVWPYSQTKPDGEQNRAILDDSKVRIVKIDRVELDDKAQLIPNSEQTL